MTMRITQQERPYRNAHWAGDLAASGTRVYTRHYATREQAEADADRMAVGGETVHLEVWDADVADDPINQGWALYDRRPRETGMEAQADRGPYGMDNCAACGQEWPDGQEVCDNCQALPGESDVDRSLRLAEEDAKPAPFQIVFTFETAEELAAALAYVGDGDAPVMPVDGSTVTVDGSSYPLWDGYEEALAHLTRLDTNPLQD